MRVVGDEVDARLHGGRDEGDVAAEAVELGDEERGALLFAALQGERELGSVVPGAALDLDELGDEAGAAAQPGRGGTNSRGGLISGQSNPISSVAGGSSRAA